MSKILYKHTRKIHDHQCCKYRRLGSTLPLCFPFSITSSLSHPFPHFFLYPSILTSHLFSVFTPQSFLPVVPFLTLLILWELTTHQLIFAPWTVWDAVAHLCHVHTGAVVTREAAWAGRYLGRAYSKRRKHFFRQSLPLWPDFINSWCSNHVVFIIYKLCIWPTAVVYALVWGIPAMWSPVTEMLVVNTLVPTQAQNLARATGGDTLLLITPIHTVRLPITPPGPRHTLPFGGTAELIWSTSWKNRRL